MTTALRLELEQPAITLDLNDPDNNGFIISSMDLGLPPARVVSDSLPGRDGTFDQTRYFDAKSVSLSGAIVPTLAGESRSKGLDKLAPFLRPGAGGTLVYALDDDMSERRLDFSYTTNWANPIDHPINASKFTFQLVCPNPIAYDATVNEIDVPFATGSTAGVTFPITMPLTFPAVAFTGGNAFVITNGTYASWPTLRIFGPCTDPAIYWLDPTTTDDLGIQVVFSGLTVADGDYVEVNTQSQSALLNGLAASSVYNVLDFAASTWGPLQPGQNLLRFVPATADVHCICEVLWRDSFLS